MTDAIDIIEQTEDDFDDSADDSADDKAIKGLINNAVQKVYLTHAVTDAQVGIRLDKLASELFDEFSRASIQNHIQTGELLVNDKKVKPKYAVKADDQLILATKKVPHSIDSPEDIALDKIYEDEEVLVINKPANMVVHPGAGNRTGTLVNALLFHYPNQAHLPRAGLVHRIDKYTTGLLLIAKTAQAQLALIHQLKEKTVYRKYQCVVKGTPQELAHHRIIDAPIARHPKERTKMAVRSGGKPAITQIDKVVALSEHYCLVDVLLQTGRTHQIRVHLSSIGHSLVGDKTYSSSPKKGLSEQECHIVSTFSRQALHAHTLGFVHPKTQDSMTVSCPLPEDMQLLIQALQRR